jgi:hypothetical protein
VLTAAERPRATASRLRGRPAIVKSIRSLLIRVSRFGRGRAITPADVAWACRVADGLAGVLRAAGASSDGHPDPGTPVDRAGAHSHEGRP